MPDSQPVPVPFEHEAHEMNEAERRFYRRYRCSHPTSGAACATPVTVLTSHLVMEEGALRPTRRHRAMCAEHGRAYAVEHCVPLEPAPVPACTAPVRVSAARLPGGSTGVSLLVPLGDVTTVDVADGGRVLTRGELHDVPEVAVPLTLDAARALRHALDRQIGELEAVDGGGVR